MEDETDHLSRKRASQEIRSLYYKYKESVCNFGEGGNQPKVKPVGRFIGFWVHERRFAAFHIHPDHFKIWLSVKSGTIIDPMERTNRTRKWHTIWNVRDEGNFDYILGLIHQAYLQRARFTPWNDAMKRMTSMHANYSAVIRRDAKWWIGWIEEVPGVNSQGKTRKELLENLRSALREALEMNRAEARQAAGKSFEEASISL